MGRRCAPAGPGRLAPKRSATGPAARQPLLRDARIGGEAVSWPLLPRLYWARVNGRGRAVGAWIDRKCDGLSGGPPKALTPAANQRGDFGTSRWAGSKLGYLN